MEQEVNNGFCCTPSNRNISCCKVESLISVDERGQMVLPKGIRDKANIRPGDKLALITWERDGQICCLSLIKAEQLADMVRGLLGPLMKDLVEQ